MSRVRCGPVPIHAPTPQFDAIGRITVPACYHLKMLTWPEEFGEILIQEAQLESRVAQLGQQITSDFQGKIPLVVAALRGATVFHSDLIRHIDLHLQVDFISVASYAANETSGKVRLIKDLEGSIEGLDVILVEDIVDTGLTSQYLLAKLNSRRPASLHTCALLSKRSRRRVGVSIDYLGFEIPDRFVVGYGLDHNQGFRNLPFIATFDGVTRS